MIKPHSLFIVAMGIVLFLFLLSYEEAKATEMVQAQCLPEGQYETDVAEAYNYGHFVGTREGYVNGQVDAARQMLDWFEQQCSTEGEVHLSNGVSLECK